MAIEAIHGEIGTETEATGFKAPRRFSHTGTDMAGGSTMFGAQTYTGLGGGEQSMGTNDTREHQAQSALGKPWHMDRFGYYGVQCRDVARDTNGWRTYEEHRLIK